MGGQLSKWGKVICLLASFSFLIGRANFSSAQDSYNPKSENAALALSLFGTILPVGTGIMLELDNDRESGFPFWLAAGGLVVGPSLGYFYAGLDQRAWKGIAIRSTVTLATLFIVAAVPDGISIQKSPGKDRWGDPPLDEFFLVVGSSVVVISTLADIILVSKHVKKRNQKLWYGSFAVRPQYFPRHKATGLQLQVVF